MTLGIGLTLEFDILLNHEATGRYGIDERLFMRKRRGESLDHVMMKFLSYLVFHHPDLEIEASADQRYKPDLVRFDARGEPVVWIDCGTTSLRKLDAIARQNRETGFVIVKPTRGPLERYRHEALEDVSGAERICYMAFERGVVSKLCEWVRGRHEIVATVSGPRRSHLFVSVDGRDLETAIVRLPGIDAPGPGRDGCRYVDALDSTDHPA